MLFIRRHPVVSKFLIILILILILCFVFIRSVIYPVFFTLAEVRAHNMGNQIINEVVDREMAQVEYGDLINYEVNEQGDIILMQANIRKINQIASKISINIQQQFQPRLNIQIPALSILGFDMLAGMGPDINVRIIPVAYIKPPELIDKFEAAGINQTRHKIYLQTQMKIKLLAPLARKDLYLTADIPVIEATLLGRVPEVYVDFGEKGLSGVLE